MTPAWRRTGDVYFPVAAEVDGQWWVLRINAFPDHPLWTLFVDGVKRYDVDDTPPSWGEPANRSAPKLADDVVRRILAPVSGFVAFGSEVGSPCSNPFCCG